MKFWKSLHFYSEKLRILFNTSQIKFFCNGKNSQTAPIIHSILQNSNATVSSIIFSTGQDFISCNFSEIREAIPKLLKTSWKSSLRSQSGAFSVVIYSIATLKLPLWSHQRWFFNLFLNQFWNYLLFLNQFWNCLTT